MQKDIGSTAEKAPAQSVEPLLTLEEVAAFLRVSTATVRRWTNDGRLPCYRFGPSRQRRFSRETVFAFVAKHEEHKSPA